MFLVRESGLKKVKVDEARRLIGNPTTVIVAYRPDDRPSPLPLSHSGRKQTARWSGGRSPCVLRPGTLVFVVPESARSVPEP